jgi:hypothetical protein
MLIEMHDKMGQRGSAFKAASGRRLLGTVIPTRSGAIVDVDPDEAEDTIALLQRSGIIVSYNESELPGNQPKEEKEKPWHKEGISNWGHGKERLQTREKYPPRHQKREPERI